MGTRNLTAVYIDGEYKIAQYGQWDGYPEGQGKTTLYFARKLADENFRREFSKKVRACRWITKEEIDAINAKVKSGEIKDWTRQYPELWRDAGAKILQMVMDRGGLSLENDIEFAADSLLCEWAWVIDLDKNTFEGFYGFNQTPIDSDERFYFLVDKERTTHNGEHYCCVRLGKAYSLDDLPSDEQFFEDFKDDEDSFEDDEE